MKRSSGFTLIELLAVIPIIAIPRCVAASALSRAKEKARTTLCLNNQKQLHLALQLYSEENNKLPSNWDYGASIERDFPNWVGGGE